MNESEATTVSITLDRTQAAKIVRMFGWEMPSVIRDATQSWAVMARAILLHDILATEGLYVDLEAFGGSFTDIKYDTNGRPIEHCIKCHEALHVMTRREDLVQWHKNLMCVACATKARGEASTHEVG